MCVCFLGMVLLDPSHFQFNHFSFYLMGHKMSQREKYIHHLYLGNYDNIGYLSREELRGRGRVMGCVRCLKVSHVGEKMKQKRCRGC